MVQGRRSRSRAEAEEYFLAVQDVEPEHRRARVCPDLGGCGVEEAKAGEFLDAVDDGVGVAAGEAGGALPVFLVVGPAGQDHRPGGVGQQHPDAQAGGPDAADADLVEGFLDDAVEGLAGESGEVDGDVLAGERLLDERPDPGRRGSEHRRPRGCGMGLSAVAAGLVPVEGAGGDRLEKLLGGPAGEPLLQDAAVIGVGQAAQCPAGPAVELGAAGVLPGEAWVDAGGGLVVLGAERGVVLPVTLAQ